MQDQNDFDRNNPNNGNGGGGNGFMQNYVSISHIMFLKEAQYHKEARKRDIERMKKEF